MEQATHPLLLFGAQQRTPLLLRPTLRKPLLLLGFACLLGNFALVLLGQLGVDIRPDLSQFSGRLGNAAYSTVSLSVSLSARRKAYLGLDGDFAHQVDQVEGNLNPWGGFLHLPLGRQTQGEDQVSRFDGLCQGSLGRSSSGLVRDLTSRSGTIRVGDSRRAAKGCLRQDS